MASGKSLQGKVAIVTGASRGIGRAISLRLAEDGAAIALAARTANDLAKVEAEIKSAGGKAASFAMDLRRPEAPAALVEATIKTFGALDIVVNNAGATKRGDFFELTDADWQDGYALKFFGAVRLTRAAWPHLKASRGSILSIIGIGGRTPGPEFTIGGSVNGACLSFIKALTDIGIRDGVQVNAINPGRIRTGRFQTMVGAQAVKSGISAKAAVEEIIRKANIVRLGEPEDVASLTAYIVSPGARFLQGALIDLDGGQTKTV